MAKKGFKFTGLSRQTPNTIQLGAGVFLVNVPEFKAEPDFAAIVKAVTNARKSGNILGATRGGGTFVANVEISAIEIDGMTDPLPGTQEVTGGESRLTGTLVSVDLDSISRVLPMAFKKEILGSITRSKVLLPEHYLKNVLWVGNKANGGAIAIMIYNALNTEGMTLTFPNSGGATMPFSYLAHQGDAMEDQEAPFDIWDIKPPSDEDIDDILGGLDSLASPIEGFTIAQMVEYANENNIEIPPGTTKHSDIAEIINDHLGIGVVAGGVKVDE